MDQPRAHSQMQALVRALTHNVHNTCTTHTTHAHNTRTTHTHATHAPLPAQVTLNEDPKTRLIRELRAEVAFLRSQLAALQGPNAAALTIPGAMCAQAPPPLLPTSLPKQAAPMPDQPHSPTKVRAPEHVPALRPH